MSSFVIHLTIPMFVALSTGVFRLRDVLIWSWAAWAVDLDYVGWMLHVRYGWPNMHRALFHNAWLLIAALALLWWAWRRWERTSGGSPLEFARAQPGWVLVPFYYFTHLFLDLFAGGITVWWPVSFMSIYWGFSLDIDTTRPIPRPIIESQIGTYQGVPDTSQIYTWLTGEEFAIFLLYLAAVGGYLVADHLKRARPLAAAAAVDVTQRSPAPVRWWRWALVAVVWVAAMVAVSFVTARL